MSENSGQQLLVRARFNFQQTNEDELTFTKGDIISVTRQEEGGWWEGMLNGKTGWFPSNYAREVKGSGKYLKYLWAVDTLQYISWLIAMLRPKHHRLNVLRMFWIKTFLHLSILTD